MNNRLNMAVDLLWVKHNKIGGVESYIRNILDGLMSIEDDYSIKLLLASDNFDSFSMYSRDSRFELIKCDVNSMNVVNRIIWQNFNLGKLLKKIGVNVCFEPHNYVPTLGVKNIKFVCTLHDLQLMHYPGNFSRKKRVWFKYNWKNTLKKSKRIVAISNDVRKDINYYFPGFDDKIKVIYNPIIVDTNDVLSEGEVEKKFNIKNGEYYYTVSSLHPHKNLSTLLKVFNKIKTQNIDLPHKLLISGIGGTAEGQFLDELQKLDLVDDVILTGFVDDTTRNSLYKGCKTFLFPSVFEGFGMPPIEAMVFNTPVITTRLSCLEEVTQGKANYVEDPYDEDEWIEIMKKPLFKELDMEKYDKYNIAKKYYQVFCSIN